MTVKTVAYFGLFFIDDKDDAMVCLYYSPLLHHIKGHYSTGWAEHGKQFALRPAYIRVGDDTQAYGIWLRFNKWRQGLFAKRTFSNWGLVRPIKKVLGGTVDFSGKTTETKYGQW